jgi:hypothetical protein
VVAGGGVVETAWPERIGRIITGLAGGDERVDQLVEQVSS